MGRDWLDQVASFACSVEVEKEPATVSERPSKAGGTKQKGVAMLVTFASVMPQRVSVMLVVLYTPKLS